jgi:adenylate kinase family enzyme
MTTNTIERAVTGEGLKVRPSAVLSFAAPIEAGKTTVSTSVAARLDVPRVSFGGYLRRLAQQMGLEVTREVLQDLGNRLVSDDVRAFCDEVLKEQPWQEGRPLIVDGVRHIEVLDTLRDMLAPAEEYLIYIKVDRATQSKRLEHDELRHEKPLEELEQHPTEVQVRSKLPDRASLVLDGTQHPEELTQKVIEFLEARAVVGGKDHGWQQKNARRIELAEKKSREGLDSAEFAEFDQLQTEYFDYLDAKYPRTPVDLERLAQIEARLKASEGD